MCLLRILVLIVQLTQRFLRYFRDRQTQMTCILKQACDLIAQAEAFERASQHRADANHMRVQHIAPARRRGS